MPKWSRDYLLTSVLAGIAAVLGLAMALEWSVLDKDRTRTLHGSPAKITPAEEAEVGDEEDFELPALEEYKQMTERPLFMETRRPSEEAPPVATAPPPQMPLNVKLMGIVFTPTGKTALMVDGKGKYKRLKVNETIDGWTVAELGSDKVIIQQGEERKDLPLLKPKPKTPTSGSQASPVTRKPPPQPQPQQPQPNPEDMEDQPEEIPEDELDTEIDSEDMTDPESME